jgi:D-lactate dehydrogenase
MPPTTRPGAAAVYLPACVNRIFGRDPEGADGDPQAPASLPEALVAVSLRARKPLWIPAGIAGTCCGTPWVSKGYRDGAGWMLNSTVEDLWRWSDGGRIPIVIDASSCTHGLLESTGLLNGPNAERLGAMTILDSVAWAADHLLPDLTVGERIGSAVIHPTCSGTHLGLNGELERLAAALANEVVVPDEATCCGFAGDRGFLHPELSASATAGEARQVAAANGDAHVCANRTCEIGLTRATGETYESFVYLLERLTR